MVTKDCYFLMDGLDVHENERRMHCICEKCVVENKIDGAWWWNGKKLGYSNYIYACEKCGEIIYQPENHDRKTN